MATPTNWPNTGPVTSMFVQFEYANDPDASSDIETAEMAGQLQAYYQWARRIVRRFGSGNARINRILTGDKATNCTSFWGAGSAGCARSGHSLRLGPAARAAEPNCRCILGIGNGR
ncbi:MAG: hypothetical protein IPJ94_30705 [Chloroflexi bacterium]|nr:hypothetical protein [Chloroflexota bacterium]